MLAEWPATEREAVLAGRVRVARGSPGGRSLERYRVTPVAVWLVSTACLFSQGALSAHGQTTEATALVLLSPAGLDRWCQQAVFRRHVFGVLADRLAELKALGDNLGTVHEIVSRLLARFERAGGVRLSRERIEVLDGAARRQVAAGERSL